MRLEDLKRTHLLKAYDEWSDRKVSARTLLHAHDLMRAALNMAVGDEYITRNPVRSIASGDLPKAKRYESRILTESQLQALLAAGKRPTQRSINRRYLSAYPAVFFAAYTGARRGEELATRWRDLNLDDGSVIISRSLSETKYGRNFKEPKHDRARTISISKALVAVLRAHRASQAAERLAMGAGYQDQDLIFARPDGSPIPPWNFGSAFRDLVKRSGVPRIRLHDLRDTHASLLAKAGVPLHVISRRLGHSSITITADRYLGMYRDQDEAAASAFKRLVG